MTSFKLGALDYLAVVLFLVIICLIGYFSGRGERKTVNDYFLAGNRLPWYLVGASLAAANLSTEQFIGMVSWAVIFGACVGLWTWSIVFDITLLIFLWVPFLMASRVFTVPQFLERRYNKEIRLTFALISIVINVVSYMGAVLYAGGLALQQLFGWNIPLSVILIGTIAGIWAIYGGLSSVARTDIFTLVVLVAGSATVVYLGLHALAPHSLLEGIRILLERNHAQSGIWAEAVRRHQDVFTGAHTYNRLSVFQPADHVAIPTLGLFLSSLSIGIWYNAMNQTVIQRVLAAKNVYHARMGLVFQGLLYFFMPILIVVPGLILFALHPEILLQGWDKVQAAADRSYIQLIQSVMPVGLRGLFLAALFGAVYSTVNSVLNSTATLFTLDIYRERINTNASDKDLIRVGMWSSAIILATAVSIAILISQLKVSLFYYMQTLNSFIAPPFAAIFVLGILWRRMNVRGAVMGLGVGFTGALLLKIAPSMFEHFPRWASTILNQAGLTLVISISAGVITALLTSPPTPQQTSDDLTFSWSNRFLRSGFGGRSWSNVIVWWLLLVLMTAAIMIFFSPLVFK